MEGSVNTVINLRFLGGGGVDCLSDFHFLKKVSDLWS